MLSKIHIVPCRVTCILPFIYYLEGYHQNNKVLIFQPQITVMNKRVKSKDKTGQDMVHSISIHNSTLTLFSTKGLAIQL